MEVAIALGCTQQNYEFYELGRNTISLDRLREFAEALRIAPHALHDVLYPVTSTGERDSADFNSPGRHEREVAVSRPTTPGYRIRSVTAPLSRC